MSAFHVLLGIMAVCLAAIIVVFTVWGVVEIALLVLKTLRRM